MRTKLCRGLLIASLVLGLSLPGVPMAADTLGGESEALEVTTHPAANITATSAILHGYLGSLDEHTPPASAREPIRLSLILQAGTPVDSIETLGIEEHTVLGSASRLRPVTLAHWVGDPDGIASGDELILDLFPDASYAAVIDRVTTNRLGTVSVRGRLPECPASYVLMSTHAGRTLASVRIPAQSRHYLVLYDPYTDAHYVAELDPDKMDELRPSPPLVPPPSGPQKEMKIGALQEHMAAGLGPEDPATSDVMIVYTRAAEEWADAYGGGIHNVISQAMEKAELVMENSETGASMRLVHSTAVDYDESLADYVTHLDRLTDPDDGYMDEVHEWRDEYGADLVALFAKVDDVGGVAWLLNSSTGRPDRGFSLTRVQQAATTYTHIHELGHNMGCHHHKEQNFQPGPTDWFGWPENIWSAGWRWTGEDSGHYCSVMTYWSGEYFDDGVDHIQVPYFSNPSIPYQGEATGHPVDGDNARTIREIKHVVAAYRESVGDFLVSFEWWHDPADKKQTHTQVMSAPGPFSTALLGLEPGKTYYFRARATKGDIVAYGDEMEFTTEIAVATEIRDWQQLNAVRDNMGGIYVLINDLDSTTAGYEELAGPDADGGNGWLPIGGFGDLFTGRFDGQGRDIRGLSINRPDEDGVGLFGATEQGAVIENVGVLDAHVVGQSYVGGLAGLSRWGAAIRNSHFSGSVTGTDYVGGVVGANMYGSTVDTCHAVASVDGHTSTGGLVGLNYEGTVSSSHAAGSVTGHDYVGGLVGWNSWGTVMDCHSAGEVTGERWVGGLVGPNYSGTVTDSYSEASVIGTLSVGGLAGTNEGGGVVENCYASGNVYGGDHVGGLVGWNGDGATVSDSHSGGIVIGDDYVGGLLGSNYLSTVSSSYANDSVTGTNAVGGLVGNNHQGSVSASHSGGSVIGYSRVGGLTGVNYRGSITDSSASGSVTGDSWVGGLAGTNTDATIAHSHSSGAVSGTWSTGGLAGTNEEDGVVDHCYATGNISGGDHAGGLIGWNGNGATVSNSYATGSVTGNDCIGGLVGSNHYGTVDGSYADASVSGTTDVGGLVGVNDGTVVDAYARGTVTGDMWVGGLVGANTLEGDISNCYSTGIVSGDSGLGGLVGWNGGTVGNSFWDVQASGLEVSDGGTGKTTAEMMNIATFTGAGWHITAVASGETDDGYIWNIINGRTYPFLSWQDPVEAPGALILGQTREVNCAILPGVTVALYDEDEAEVYTMISDGDGNYTLVAPELGEYTVVASIAGFRNKERSISVTELTSYTVEFVADHGLIPNEPDMSYVLACINLWQYGSPYCKLTMSTVLAVINAWQVPILVDEGG